MGHSQLLLDLAASFPMDYHSDLTCGQSVMFTVCPSFVYGVIETHFEVANLHCQEESVQYGEGLQILGRILRCVIPVVLVQ